MATREQMLTKITLSAALLEIEALTMLARAKLLQDDGAGFHTRIVEARAKLVALHDEVLQTKSEYYLAAAPREETTVVAGDAPKVDS